MSCSLPLACWAASWFARVLDVDTLFHVLVD